MDLAFSAEEEAFRREVRAWLDAHRVPEPPSGTDLDSHVRALREWQAALAGAKLVGVHWPEAYGGRGLTWIHNFIVQEELARAHAPEIINRIGVNLVGPTLQEHGTAAQQHRWLPGILPATELWCQLFSEPDAGSDLASLKTTARREGDTYVVNGQKVWSSYAQYARWGYLLARTDSDAPTHKGISALVIDMHAPGVEVRPLRQMTGEEEFNEVFLSDVVVEGASRLGAENDGWRIASTTLSHERGTSPRQLVVHAMLLDTLLDLARTTARDDPLIRQELARAYSDIQVFRLHNFRTLTDVLRDGQPGPQSSVVKLFWSEMSQRMHDLGVRLAGPAAYADPDTVGVEGLVRNMLYYRAATIFAGTSEVQRNVIGERSLGLPREPRPLS
ncbi:MAG: acyl-CoA dehydrogenase family protein [Acidimicrobiia bacterium]|nr:acyl-CoA dehydrogenase family protein [Acidimicrobiia bacterium]